MSEVFQTLLPGMMYFWVMFIGQGPFQEVLNEKDIRTLPRMLAAPVTVSQFVLSKMIRCVILCALVQTLLLLLSAALFGIEWGRPAMLAAVVVVSAFSMTGLLAFLYSLAKTREQANALSTIALLICAMVGGGMFPFDQLPKFLQAIGQFTPNRWAVVAIQGAVKLKGWTDMAMPFGILIAIGLAGAVIAYYLLQRQLANAR